QLKPLTKLKSLLRPAQRLPSLLACSRDVRSTRVSQIVEIGRYAIPVDPGRADSEPVERRPEVFVARPQVQCAGLFIQPDGDLAIAIGPGRVVAQEPIVNTPIGKNAGRLAVIRAERSFLIAMSPVNGIEEKALGRRTLYVDAQVVHRHGVFLRGIAAHAEVGIVETNRRRAVADAAQHGNLASSLQGSFQAEPLDAVAIRGHPAGFPAIPSENQTAQFPRLFAAGVMSRAPAEIKLGPRVGRGVSASIVECIPIRILPKIKRDSIDLHIFHSQGLPLGMFRALIRSPGTISPMTPAPARQRLVQYSKWQ